MRYTVPQMQYRRPNQAAGLPVDCITDRSMSVQSNISKMKPFKVVINVKD